MSSFLIFIIFTRQNFLLTFCCHKIGQINAFVVSSDGWSNTVVLTVCKWILKFRHYEKATKFEKISHLFWQNSYFYSVGSKKVAYFFFWIFVAFSEKLDFKWLWRIQAFIGTQNKNNFWNPMRAPKYYIQNYSKF